MTPSLAVIFVNYRSSKLLLDALSSLYRETAGTPPDVWVVDNASGDDSRDRILDAFPAVQWIDMGYNAGFARANNAGIRAAGDKDVLLLNPDTIVLDRAVEKAYAQLCDSDFVACGVQLLNPDGSPQISGNFFMKGGLNHLLLLPYLGALLRWIGYRSGTKVPNVREAGSVHPVEWVSGAFLMVKRSAIRQAGLMDEDFFLYAEEVEWCARLGKVGPLCIFGEERIIHLQGETVQDGKGYSGLTTRKDFQLMLSNHLRVRKQFGVGWFLVLLLGYTAGVPVFFLGNIFTLRGLSAPAQFARNVARLWWWTPRIIGGRPHFYKVL
ncbi:glycosyltransferase family 2 protein [Dinghuibacter silviterrae]|uniref:Glycosyltransferase 2-like domain-containing protein n=1 Tax=Dinghuibacter silviterrae TaxID=1539049 RepID=A0A4V3GKR6_9BACT|nr:glycosyltransferase family 2 protein [Dinghuibacter silviterrae]TDW96642.1 hypothetical protein EDB95_4476 [Dinghuibacter silviterrae]